MRLRLVLLTVCVGFSTQVIADDWPVFQQNNQRNAKSSESLSVQTLGAAWRWQSAGVPRPAWSGPAKWDAYAGISGLKSMRNYDPAYHVIAVGNLMWFGSTSDDSVYCLDAATGAERWQFCTDGPIRMAPTFDDDRIFVGSDDGYVYCLGAESGELIWKFQPKPTTRRILNNGRLISEWPVRTGVLVDGGVAYFGASLLPWQESYLCAVATLNGSPDGDRCFVRRLDDVTMEGPLAIMPGRYLLSVQGRVAPKVFSLSDGTPRGSLSGGGGSFVVLTNDSVFHGPGNKTGWLTASSLETLESVASIRNGNAMVVAGDVSFVLTDDSLMASNYVNRKAIWSTDCAGGLCLILVGDTLFVGAEDRIDAFDTKDGRAVWSHPVSGKVFSLSVAQQRLFASTDTGAIYAFEGGRPSPVASLLKAPANLEDGHQSPLEQTGARLHQLAAASDSGLLAQWLFQQPHVVAGRVANLSAHSQFSLELEEGSRPRTVGRLQAIAMGNPQGALRVTEDLSAAILPRREFTVEAWVRVDEATRWGAFAGLIQDNGDYERGWLLGLEDRRFSFAVCGTEGSGRLTFLAANSEYELNQWYHVAGSYDGQEMRLYVDGELAAISKDQRGDIQYPGRGVLALGAYLDQDEEYVLQGMIHEVRLYDRQLEAAEITAHHAEKATEFPAPQLAAPRGARPAIGPWLTFAAGGSATVRWRTHSPSPTRLTLTFNDQLVKQYDNSELVTEHEVTLDSLQHERRYHYRIEFQEANQTLLTDEYECDTFFNFFADGGLPKTPSPQEDLADESTQSLLDEILSVHGTGPGLCICLDFADESLVRQLVARSDLRVIMFDESAADVQHLREVFSDAAMYGRRVAVHHVDSLAALPVTMRIADVAIGTSDPPATNRGPVLRQLLTPYGTAWEQTMGVNGGTTTWTTIEGEPIAGAGEWSHTYGDAANSHFGGESLAGARTADELVVQWLGRPGPRYQADRNGRKPSPISTAGRIFLQGLHRIVALNQYNGTILWSIEIPEVDRYNVPRDCGNWCADHDHVFLAVRDRCWQINAATGIVEADESLPERDAVGNEWGYVARAGDLLIGSVVPAGTSWTRFWGKDAWYDGTDGPVADKICSNALFARDLRTGKVAWRYQNGAVVNVTISADDETLYFVESRGDYLAQTMSRRLGGPDFWRDQWLVAIDLKTGQVRWEQPLDTADGTVAFYMAHAHDRLVLVASTEGNYHVYSINDADGTAVWHRTTPWGKGKADHGSHLSRPAIVGNRLFVRPAVFDLTTGEKLPLEIPVGGCGTYAATSQALFFRGGSGQNSAMWDQVEGKYSMWSRLRPDCWLSTIPSGGMLLSPEGGGGCSCGSWLETSIGFMPRANLLLDATREVTDDTVQP